MNTIRTDMLKVGAVYECTRDFYMDDGELDYIKGKKYLCEQNGCFTDEQGCKDHMFSILNEDLLRKHFKRVK